MTQGKIPEKVEGAIEGSNFVGACLLAAGAMLHLTGGDYVGGVLGSGLVIWSTSLLWMYIAQVEADKKAARVVRATVEELIQP
jgi:hypothetical protein